MIVAGCIHSSDTLFSRHVDSRDRLRRRPSMAEPVQCPSCLTVMPSNAAFCPNCEQPRTVTATRRTARAAESGVPYEVLLERERLATLPTSIQELQEFAIELVRQSRTSSDVQHILRENGVPAPIAASWVSQIIEARNAAKRTDGIKNLLVGGGICVAGLTITLITYAAASPGETYVVAWGAVLFGGFRGLVGLVNLLEGWNRS